MSPVASHALAFLAGCVFGPLFVAAVLLIRFFAEAWLDAVNR